MLWQQHHTGALMDINTIASLIDRFGLAILILLLLIRWLQPKLDSMFDLLMRLASQRTCAKEDESEAIKKSREGVYKSMVADEKVLQVVRSLILEFRCSRAYVFLYHNGGKNLLGSGFARLSCTHEACAIGVRPQQGQLQGMLITMVWAFVKCISVSGKLECPDVADCFKDTDSSVYETLALQNIQSVYCVALPGEDRVPFGFLGLDYCKEKVLLSKEEMEKLKLVAERVATILCVSGHHMCGAQCDTQAEQKENFRGLEQS
jgi:hypothetical protein